MRRRYLKIYGWNHWGGHCDYRRIMAAHSLKEVRALNGNPRGGLWNLTETNNALERATALTAPLAVFERKSDDALRGRGEFRLVQPAPREGEEPAK